MYTTHIFRAALLSTAFFSASSFGASLSFNATADVNAKERFPDQNFGADIMIQTSSQTGFQKITYLKFDVSGIPTGSTGITAQLRLRSQTTTSGTPHAVSAHIETNTGWTETGVTWNAKPALGSVLSTVSNHTSGADSVW